MPDAALAALFDALAAAQRGVPESMLKEASNPGVTNAEGVYTWLLMHTGDLVHRAAVADQPEWGVDAISGKVGQIKRVLDHGYGVGREVEEQIRGGRRRGALRRRLRGAAAGHPDPALGPRRGGRRRPHGLGRRAPPHRSALGTR